MSKIIRFAILLAMLVLSTVVLTAQETHDLVWLNDVVKEDDYSTQILLAYNKAEEDGRWHSEGNGATLSFPSFTVVLADVNNAGNSSYEEIANGVWFTTPGGTFGTDGFFRAFQLEGDHPEANAETIDDMIETVLEIDDYAKMIETLDVQWSGGTSAINRWAGLGPMEVLTDDQLDILEEANSPLQPVIIDLPGNTLVWGTLASGNLHYGLVLISQNVYATTCQGGRFTTFEGYRAMQFEPTMEESIISDTTGCNGQYPVLDTDNIESVQPLSD